MSSEIFSTILQSLSLVFLLGAAHTICLNPSFRASSMRLSRERTRLTFPVSESSPINTVFLRGMFFRELKTAAASARSIPGSLRESHLPIFANTS